LLDFDIFLRTAWKFDVDWLTNLKKGTWWRMQRSFQQILRRHVSDESAIVGGKSCVLCLIVSKLCIVNYTFLKELTISLLCLLYLHYAEKAGRLDIS
jgi:hypothetical protein